MPVLRVSLLEVPGKVAGLARRAARALLGLASYWSLLMSVAAQGSGAASTIQELQGQIATAVSAAGGLLFAMAAALFAAGLAFKFTPWASQRTKDLGGMLLDHGLILAALASVGLFLLVFAGQIATGVVGQGSVPQVGGAWQVPTQ
jgi:hypothetical protein